MSAVLKCVSEIEQKTPSLLPSPCPLYTAGAFEVRYMPEKFDSHVEVIAEDEIEVLDASGDSPEEIVRISADEETSDTNVDPLRKLLEHANEFRKIKFFGPLALLLSIVGILLYPLYLSSAAICFALLDLWKGSKFTHKISYVALVLGILSLLNTWT